MQQRTELGNPHPTIVQRNVRFALVEPGVSREVDHVIVAVRTSRITVLYVASAPRSSRTRAPFYTVEERRDVFGLATRSRQRETSLKKSR